MQNIFEILPENKDTAIALGYFDGIHIGHRKVLSLAANEAENGLLSVCFTFSKSPKNIITGKPEQALMTNADKLTTLENLGINQTVQADFDILRNIPAEEFFTDILAGRMRAKKLFCGFNYRFGKNGEGDVELLQKLCRKHSVELEVVPAKVYNNTAVSSTFIRDLIINGDIGTANRLLCTRFGFSSVIEHGAQLGRTIGTPTINQPLCSELVVPKFGVYASVVTLQNKMKYCGVTNIGIKPTVGGTLPLCETWMPEYHDKEIYGEIADVRLIEFIRPEKKFESIDELTRAIKANGKTALEIFHSEDF